MPPFGPLVLLALSILFLCHAANATVVKILTQKQEASMRTWVDQYYAAWSATSGVTIEIHEAASSDTAEYLGVMKTLGRIESSNYDLYNFDIAYTAVLAPYLLELGKYSQNGEFSSPYPSIVSNVATQDKHILVSDVVEGRLLGLPSYMNLGLMYYRKDLLARANFTSPPKTWDEMEHMAKVVLANENNSSLTGWVGQFAQYEGLTCNAVEFIASCGGGSIIEPDGTVSINRPSAAAMLTRVKNWISQSQITIPDVLMYREADTTKKFFSGQAVFMRFWDGYNDFREGPMSGQLDAGGIVGVAPLPGCSEGQTAATLGGWHVGVNKFTTKPEAAVIAASFLTSYQYQRDRALQYSPYWPTHPALYDDTTFCAGNFSVWCNALKSVTTVARPTAVSGSSYDKVSSDVFVTVSNILSDQVSASSALATLFVQLHLVLGITLPADTIEYLTTAGNILVAFTTFLMGITLITGILFFGYRNHPVVRSSSLIFLELILFGLMMSYSTVFLYIKAKDENVCRVIPIPLVMSFGLVNGSILAKTWRIRTIFAARIRIGKITDLKTLRIALGIVVIEGLLLAIWLTVAPPKPNILSVNTTTRYWECSMGGTTARDILSAVVLIFNALVLIATTLLAYSIRNVAARYNESKLIGLAMYNIVTFVVIIPIIAQTTGNPLVIPVGILVITSLVYGIFFLPKVKTLLVSPHQPLMKDDAPTGNGAVLSGSELSTEKIGTNSFSKLDKVEVVEGHADVRIARSKLLIGVSRWVRRSIILVPNRSVVAEIPLEEASEYKGTTVQVEDLKILNVIKSPESGYCLLIQLNNNLVWELQTSTPESLDEWIGHFKSVRCTRKSHTIDSLKGPISTRAMTSGNV
ncbi:uncharacterized protein SPPG_04236 [Spizellomyces punctatus DAOM BR117]|uniref:G-protein coupled receptors family 3 profile domain-containing protein n=1 Tax=Spizellomyces punctatus (strain DAOM BR117) TaxID=645134 RepID=A0A0L0HJZ7_SPIPD|nr:uncharacterized protein SPPG_04236 [Spizellomyces punctatus DAOM BR117]KND01144.1 hypothetical protein SPPG_04236 [Spizellomyces punctatus DAOM BR117]|eukprot:XP_016609183.1 hypothetical protein SPPG_04236 [Spizellomyces punctatus DAOM BR117]